MNALKHTLLLACLFSSLMAQKLNLRDSSVAAIMVIPNYNLEQPLLDLNKRFGWFNGLGISLQYKSKARWVYGVEASWHFGNTLNESNYLEPLTTKEHLFIGNDGYLQQPLYFMRGLKLNAFVGYLFPIHKRNANSGLLTTFGVGYFQHHIKIDALQTELPIVTGDYIKGFDRLSTGIALQQFAGYLYAHPTYLINFYAGLTFTEGLTKSARGYNYDTLQKDEALRKDFSIGLKIGWIIPFYQQKQSKQYYID
jgi:hypothetical protein